MKGKSEKKRKSEGTKNASGPRKKVKRAAACSKPKPAHFSKRATTVRTKRYQLTENESEAIGLTTGEDEPRPNRRLADFVFHDAEGVPQSVEMLEVSSIYISGLILPLEETSDRGKGKGFRCEGFGRVESWAFSGYEDGSPVIWVSTRLADYECIKPARSYKSLYSLFIEKAHACIEIYKNLSRSSGGNPNLSLDALLARVVHSMTGRKNFPSRASVREFIISQGEFIFNQLIGLDETCNKNDQIFSELPVLAALRNECKKNMGLYGKSERILNTNFKFGNGENTNQSSASTYPVKDDVVMKFARLLEEKEKWLSIRQKKRVRMVTASSNYHDKIKEDKVVNYPLPAYYKDSPQGSDEDIIFNKNIDTKRLDGLPRKVLNNWALYNSESRFVSLKRLPMEPSSDIDVAIFASGIMTDDGRNGFCSGVDSNGTCTSIGVHNVKGVSVYLSKVKEWTVDFGSSMVHISIRTDMAWYRLGKPLKQYSQWYEPILKTVRLTSGIIKLLKDQIRVSRLSFSDVVSRVSQFNKDHPAFVASNAKAVESYVILNGQIILQQFAKFPDDNIRKCAFVSGLRDKMGQKCHAKRLAKKKAVLKREATLNPRAAISPADPKNKAMPATTTRLINRIWGEFYSNYLPEDSKERDECAATEDEIDNEDQEEDGEEGLQEPKGEITLYIELNLQSCSARKQRKPCCSVAEVKWDMEAVGRTRQGEALYRRAIVRGSVVSVGGSVLVETDNSEKYRTIYFVEYMFESSESRKIVHGRLMLRGFQTVLGNAANEREVFLTNDCLDFELGDIIQTVVVEIRSVPWGYQYRKSNAIDDKSDRAKAKDRKNRGLSVEYFCKSMYCPDKGAFFCLQTNYLGLGSGVCNSCKIMQAEREKDVFKLNSSMTGFTYKGSDYCINDFVYLDYGADGKDVATFRSGRNVGLKAFVVCHLLEIEEVEAPEKADPESINIKVRRFFRPEDISAEQAYSSHLREVYYSEQIVIVPLISIEGKCEVRRKKNIPFMDDPVVFLHIFFCEYFYNHKNGAIEKLPGHIKLSRSKERVVNIAASKKKGKGNRGKKSFDKEKDASSTNRLAALDIFAGCGGLSEGLQKSGASVTKWAIEYEETAGEAFKLNHPEALVIINNCNVILRAIMTACGDADECISTNEAAELAAKLDEKEIDDLPRPGQVEFINGGPPCQGFSALNRYIQGSWSKVQCEMILAFLSFADYFRPKFFLLENVRNFVSFNKGQTFRLTLASLIEMGYQVRFGILEAGAYGVSQTRKRAFIWAASPDETLPEWPEPMHVFAGRELKIQLNENTHYAAVRSSSMGAPFRPITVRDAIGDLPAVRNGASATAMEYKDEPVSWFQKKIRGNAVVLTDHISKPLNELNLIRCKKVPKRPGADWRDLPDEKIVLSKGHVVDLIPWGLPNTAKRHNQWKGLLGRLDWEGNFPTSVTDPQPMGKVAMCFHPEQDRIVTVRECARSQGFPDTYKFAGNIHHKHRQVGNAVPPPLAFALGRKLKEAIESKRLEKKMK